MHNTDYEISSAQVQDWLASGDAILVDVREKEEYAEMRIPGSVCCPLSAFDADLVMQKAGDKKIIFTCRSGKRADDVYHYFTHYTGRPAYCFAASLIGWQAEGLPVETGAPG